MRRATRLSSISKSRAPRRCGSHPIHAREAGPGPAAAIGVLSSCAAEEVSARSASRGRDIFCISRFTTWGTG